MPLSKAETLTPPQRRKLINDVEAEGEQPTPRTRFEEHPLPAGVDWEGPFECQWGHLECSPQPGGPCVEEVEALEHKHQLACFGKDTVTRRGQTTA